MVSLMDRLGASVSAVNGLQTGARGSVAAYGVGEITGATPVFVAVSRHKYLFSLLSSLRGSHLFLQSRTFMFS